MLALLDWSALLLHLYKLASLSPSLVLHQLHNSYQKPKDSTSMGSASLRWIRNVDVRKFCEGSVTKIVVIANLCSLCSMIRLLRIMELAP